jgi:hypothetical protein
MHIKFMAHGTGSGSGAAAYLTQEKDHKGEVRPGIEVLRGNPEQLGKLIDSLDFVHRYSSGVIAFAPEDKPTREQVAAVLNDFEKLAFAGLDGNRYAWAAVRHDEESGGCHVHVIAARVDLQTGKSLNIAPPNWQKSYDPLRDMHNWQNGWARPDDPTRAREQRPSTPDLRKTPAGQLKEAITGVLTWESANGYLPDRKAVLERLSEFGEIKRTGKDYISIKIPDQPKNLRFSGALYEENFNADTYAKTVSADRGRQDGSTAAERANAERSRSQFEQAIQRRAEYNEGRYGLAAQEVGGHKPEIGRSAGEPAKEFHVPVLGGSGRGSDDFVRIRVASLDEEQRGERVEPESRTEPANAGRSPEASSFDFGLVQENTPNPKRPKAQKRKIDHERKELTDSNRKRADGLIGAIGQHSAKSGQIHSAVGAIASGFSQGAQERASENGQPAATNKLIEHVRGAIAELAARANSAARGVGKWVAELAQVVAKERAAEQKQSRGSSASQDWSR